MNDRLTRATALTERPLLFGLLSDAALDDPAKEAVVDGDLRLSYKDLLDRVDRYARALLAAGVGRGDRVAMLTPPSADFWVVLHATASIGAIWVGVNPRYQVRDFEHLLSDSDPALLIAMSPFEDRDYCAELAPLLAAGTPMIAHGAPSGGARALDAFLADGDRIGDAELAAARAAVDPEDAAVIVYTSGTTGRPKGAMLSQRAIVLSALANAAWMGRESLARSICAAPVNHVGAINNICANVLAARGALIFHSRVDLAALAEIGQREKPTYLVSSPTGFAMMFAQAENGTERLANTRLIVFGGAKTALPMLERIAPLGAALSSVYGQTETCGIITHTQPSDGLEAHAETIGRPLDGAELRVADANGAPVPDGETGEIQIRAPYVMSGYFRNPEATADAFTKDGFLRTGDLGQRRGDGNLVFVGRLKEMFKSGGYNVYPVEVEQAIAEHPSVALAAVVAVEHPTFQEVGFAFVEPRPGMSVTPEELKAYLKDRIANYKAPKTFVVLDELPKLPNAKIDKMTLKSLAHS